MRGYIVVSGIIFLVVAVVNATRLLIGWPVQFGTHVVPTAASWGPLLVAGALFIWAAVNSRRPRGT